MHILDTYSYKEVKLSVVIPCAALSGIITFATIYLATKLMGISIAFGVVVGLLVLATVILEEDLRPKIIYLVCFDNKDAIDKALDEYEILGRKGYNYLIRAKSKIQLD